jgi:hypothetical protein
MTVVLSKISSVRRDVVFVCQPMKVRHGRLQRFFRRHIQGSSSTIIVNRHPPFWWKTQVPVLLENLDSLYVLFANYKDADKRFG